MTHFAVGYSGLWSAAHILQMGDTFQMVWVDAPFYLASVVNLETRWNRANPVYVGCAMRVDNLAVFKPEHAVAAIVDCALPKPTGCGDFYMRQKTKRCSLVHHAHYISRVAQLQSHCTNARLGSVKNAAAVALGKLSGSRMTREQRIERARKAGLAYAASRTPEQLRDRAAKARAARKAKP